MLFLHFLLHVDHVSPYIYLQLQGVLQILFTAEEGLEECQQQFYSQLENQFSDTRRTVTSLATLRSCEHLQKQSLLAYRVNCKQPCCLHEKFLSLQTRHTHRRLAKLWNLTVIH